MSNKNKPKKKIAVIACRFKTVDDSAIEAEKWIDKYNRLDYEVHLIGGKFGEPTELKKLELPEMDYKHSEVRGVKRIMFGNALDKSGKKAANILLESLVNRIYPRLKKYIQSNKIDILSIENVLGNLKNPALCIALRKLLKDTGLPTISRYHSFYWNEPYFEKNDNFPEILKQTPPDLKNITHVTNTTSAQKDLVEKKKINSIVIPNTADIDHLQRMDDYNKDFRKTFDIADDQLIFLQPTKINRKKGIERSIKIVKEINDITKKEHVLMITGAPVYFRGDYFEEIIRKINKAKVNVIFAHDRIFLARHQNKEKKFYSMDDAYLHADIVMFPSLREDFGSPVLQAMAYHKPLFVNKYPGLNDVLEKDPKFILIDGKLTDEAISDLYEILQDKNKQKSMTDHNFNLLKQHYTSDILDDRIVPLLNKFEKSSFLRRLKRKIFSSDDKKKVPEKKQTNKKDLPIKKSEDSLRNKKGSYKEPSEEPELDLPM